MMQNHGQVGHSGGDAPARERLPSFLLSSAGASSGGFGGGVGSGGGGGGGFGSSPGGYPFTGRAAGAEPGSFEEPSATTWPFQARRGGNAPIAFNDRLRSDRGGGGSGGTGTAGRALTGGADGVTDTASPMETGGAAATDGMRTPSRMPPNKSLLDGGAPSVLQLRPPAAAPSTPGSFARGTPRRPSPSPSPSPTITPGGAAVSPRRGVISGSGGAYSGAGGGGDGRWITVFGFSADVESQALREFRRHGDVVRTVAGKGNWLHLLYRTPLQAQVALYRPWRVLAGTDVMVGAVPCTEPDIAREEDDAVERGFLVASPSPSTPATVYPSSSPRSATTTPISATIRSPTTNPALRAPSDLLRRSTAYNNSSHQPIVQTPQRQTGFLDYITGFYK